MEASVTVRLLGSTAALHRHRLPLSPLSLRHPDPRILSRNGNPSRISTLLPLPSSNKPHRPRTTLRSAPFPASPLPPFGSLLTHFVSPVYASVPPQERLDCFNSDPKEGFLQWDRSWEVLDGENLRSRGEKGAAGTVVLLGWLGAEQRHLKKYAEMYNSKGIRSVRFVIPMKEVVGFDLGRKIEEKIAELTRELVSWCSEREEDGRERYLLFHTFSNTGWLAYGRLLENLQSRTDVIEKIRGCIIDSGPASEINPQVWAAGFCAALLKKDVNRRLSKVISLLSKDQPLCPQLYLYSSADKVISVRLVENFIMEQKALGRNVYAHDFGSSPHVDHFRSYPHIYHDKVYKFIKECCHVTV